MIPSPDYSHDEENSRHSVDRGVILEERRHQRECFILCSALGATFDLFTSDLISNSPRWHLQGRTALPSFRKDCTSIAVLPRIIRAREPLAVFSVMAAACMLVLLATGVASSQEQRSGARRVAAEEEPRWVTPARERYDGTHHKTFHSRTINGPVSYLIYLPPDYERDATKRYPVLYWLHGGSGRVESGGAFVKLLDSAIREITAPPMITVLVNGLKSMYNDSLDGKQPVESVTIRDLIPHVDETYRTLPHRDGRWIEGFSMGGYGAPHLGFKYPELFGAVSNLSGAVLQWGFFSRRANGSEDEGRRKKRGNNLAEEIFGGNKALFEANHPFSLAEKNAGLIREKILVRIVVGREEGAMRVNQNFHALLDRLQIPHEFIVVPGVKHSYQRLYETLGNERAFEFYRQAFRRMGQRSPGNSTQ